MDLSLSNFQPVIWVKNSANVQFLAITLSLLVRKWVLVQVLLNGSSVSRPVGRSLSDGTTAPIHRSIAVVLFNIQSY